MTELTDPYVYYDAAYVMGALDPPDRRAYEQHLTVCDRCRSAVSELAGMPGLLAQLDVEEVLAPRATPEPPPDTLLPRMAAAAGRLQRRRKVWGGLAGLAAAACLITAIVVAAGTLTSNTPAQQGTALVMSAVTAAPVTATVRLHSVEWGTDVSLDCTYAPKKSDGDDKVAHPSYRLVVVPKDGGRVQQVAQWTGLAGKTVKMSGATDLKPSQIAEIRLVSSKDVTLLHVVPS
jgi:hypothetical protein